METLKGKKPKKTKKQGFGVVLEMLSVVILLSMCLILPAEVSAKVLHGHLDKIQIDPDGDGGVQTVKPTRVAPSETPMSSPVVPATNPNQVINQPQPVRVVESGLLNNTFPRSFEGTWKCETLVTESGVDTVMAGSKLVSDVQFARTADGRIVARWNQPGWTETQANAMTFNAKEARVDRTSYYYGEGVNGAWAARSRDHFVQIGPDTIAVKSYVDQYIDGQYVGRYRTASMLHRIYRKPEVAQNAE